MEILTIILRTNYEDASTNLICKYNCELFLKTRSNVGRLLDPLLSGSYYQSYYGLLALHSLSLGQPEKFQVREAA